MDLLDQIIKPKLDKRVADRSYRELKNIELPFDFASNDYLGLAHSDALYGTIRKKVETVQPHLNGATGSRLLSGNSVYTEIVEVKLANIFKGEKSIILNSGYVANLAVLSSVPQRNDTILYDELSHASIKDGARLSLATKYSFSHNDLADLERKLKVAKGNKFIVVESVYSMDGDQCPLYDLVKLAGQYDAHVILDEAHSTGIYGHEGAGLAVSMGIEKKIAIRIYTFGKAMGVHGACVVASNTLIEYLINFARPFIYTTALPLHAVASIDCSFTFLTENIMLQQNLQDKILLFKQYLTIPTLLDSVSAIQAVVIPGNDVVKGIAYQLQQQGFDVRPILSPTVPTGKERIRVCLHTYNTEEQIKLLAKALQFYIKQ